MRQNRSHIFNIKVANNTASQFVVSEIKTSCRCVAATADVSNPIEIGSTLLISAELNIEQESVVDRTMTILAPTDDGGTEIAYIRLKGKTLAPAIITPEVIDVSAEDGDKSIRIQVIPALKEVSLKSSKYVAVSPWKISETTANPGSEKLDFTVTMRPPNSTSIAGQLLVRFTYSDHDGEHVGESSIPIRYRPKLSVRPDNIPLRREGNSSVRLFLVGEFDPDKEHAVSLHYLLPDGTQSKEPLFTEMVRPLNSRLIISKFDLDGSKVPADADQFVVFVERDRVLVNLTAIEEK